MGILQKRLTNFLLTLQHQRIGRPLFFLIPFLNPLIKSSNNFSNIIFERDIDGINYDTLYDLVKFLLTAMLGCKNVLI